MSIIPIAWQCYYYTHTNDVQEAHVEAVDIRTAIKLAEQKPDCKCITAVRIYDAKIIEEDK